MVFRSLIKHGLQLLFLLDWVIYRLLVFLLEDSMGVHKLIILLHGLGAQLVVLQLLVFFSQLADLDPLLDVLGQLLSIVLFEQALNFGGQQIGTCLPLSPLKLELLG